MSKTAKEVRQALREGNFAFSPHAVERSDERLITREDIKHVKLSAYLCPA
jgi:hypothetical protein